LTDDTVIFDLRFCSVLSSLPKIEENQPPES